MKIITNYIDLSTKGEFDILDITDRIQQNLRITLLQEGNITIFNPGSTAAITTIEFESGLIKDIRKLFERIVPESDNYFHNEIDIPVCNQGFDQHTEFARHD